MNEHDKMLEEMRAVDRSEAQMSNLRERVMKAAATTLNDQDEENDPSYKRLFCLLERLADVAVTANGVWNISEICETSYSVSAYAAKLQHFSELSEALTALTRELERLEEG